MEALNLEFFRDTALAAEQLNTLVAKVNEIIAVISAPQGATTPESGTVITQRVFTPTVLATIATTDQGWAQPGYSTYVEGTALQSNVTMRVYQIVDGTRTLIKTEFVYPSKYSEYGIAFTNKTYDIECDPTIGIDWHVHGNTTDKHLTVEKTKVNLFNIPTLFQVYSNKELYRNHFVVKSGTGSSTRNVKDYKYFSQQGTHYNDGLGLKNAVFGTGTVKFTQPGEDPVTLSSRETTNVTIAKDLLLRSMWCVISKNIPSWSDFLANPGQYVLDSNTKHFNSTYIDNYAKVYTPDNHQDDYQQVHAFAVKKIGSSAEQMFNGCVNNFTLHQGEILVLLNKYWVSNGWPGELFMKVPLDTTEYRMRFMTYFAETNPENIITKFNLTNYFGHKWYIDNQSEYVVNNQAHIKQDLFEWGYEETVQDFNNNEYVRYGGDDYVIYAFQAPTDITFSELKFLLERAYGFK